MSRNDSNSKPVALKKVVSQTPVKRSILGHLNRRKKMLEAYLHTLESSRTSS